MRRIASALAFLLMTSFLIAHTAALPGDNTRITLKGVSLSGQVSANGKIFRADDDNAWTITNVDAIKGFEGHYVTVNCRMDPDKRSIRVLFVVEQPSNRHAANLSDSAFRR